MAELNRNALLIYLNDLRVMETVIYKSEKQLNDINNVKKQWDIYYFDYQKNKPSFSFKEPEPYNYDIPDIMRFLGWVSFLFALLVILCLIAADWSFTEMWTDCTFICIMFFGGIISIVASKRIEKNTDTKYETRRKREYDYQYSNYESNLTKYNEELQNRKNKYDNYKKNSEYHISNINGEIWKMEDMLSKAYSANIIPNQFRNIQGVYYLYDYLSTSNQSLSEALLQCNLEAIKQKLDTMINLQSEMIVEIAQQNAKTDKIIQQNRELLSSVKEVGVHTANAAEAAREAAQYAQISATNSEVTRELAEKQLAYQSAEFWLRR